MANNWKYTLKEDFECLLDTPIGKYIPFRDKNGRVWLELEPDGTLRVKEGYAWDGCSPKFKVGDLFYFGTPDGVLNDDLNYPKTYLASLVHDSLYQFINDPMMPFTRKQMDEIFLDFLLTEKFSAAKLYYYAVRIFGGIHNKVISFKRKFF